MISCKIYLFYSKNIRFTFDNEHQLRINPLLVSMTAIVLSDGSKACVISCARVNLTVEIISSQLHDSNGNNCNSRNESTPSDAHIGPRARCMVAQ